MSAYYLTYEAGDVMADSFENEVIMKDSAEKYVEKETDKENNALAENVKGKVLEVEDKFADDLEGESIEEEYSSDDSILDYSGNEVDDYYEDYEYDEENAVAEVNDESAQDMEDKEEEESENKSIENDDENTEESEFSYDEEESISDDERIDYHESELPNINFPKFVIPRVPNSAFPTDVLKYIKKNAQPQTALKLMQICKYFCHEEFPFLPMKYFRYYEDYGLSYETLQGQEVEYIADSRIFKIFKKKLWMTDEIYLDYSIRIDSFLPYIAACSLKKLYFQNQDLSIDQFKFLTCGGTIKKIYFRSVSLNYENGDPVPLEKILKCMPNIKEFSFKRCSIFHENVSAFIPFLNPAKLNFFAPGSLTENFDFETIISFITKYPKTQFSLKFKKGLPDEYFQKLQTFVEDIQKTSNYSKFEFSRIYCENQTWEYRAAEEWYELPSIHCKCGYRRTLHSNYKPPYFHCKCKNFLLLKNPEVWNQQLSYK